MSASEPGLPSARPGAGWLLRTAWRDSRGQRRLLLLFVFCIVFGVAALVAIRSLRTNLETAIETQSRALVGADLVLSTRQPPGDALEAWVAARGGEHSREWRFRSMAYFP
ncbi:MAG: ABC transporter permease, partial [Verrucomicrobiota bacterium]